MGDAFHCNFDAAGINGQLDELLQAAGDATRPAAQAGAQVFYRAVLSNAQIHRHSGKLASAIYQVYSADNSVMGEKAVYHVSWNARKAPHGHLLEHGTSRMAALPFVRPAFDAVQQQGLQAAVAEYRQSMHQYLGR